MSVNIRRGLAVSPGVAVGPAYCITDLFLRPGLEQLPGHEVGDELQRYEAALDKAARDLQSLQEKVSAQVGDKEAAIFATHRSILRDAALHKTVRDWIVQERLPAAAALHRFLQQYTEAFSKLQDEYLQGRLADIRDVVLRVHGHLADPREASLTDPSGPLIVVAEELLPSQVVGLGDLEVKGIVTDSGSQTSHAAIVARSRGIPAVSGVADIARQVKTGDLLVVDGREGRVILHPDAETCTAYLKLEREFFHFRDQLAANHDQPAVTADGVALELLANINSVADAQAAVAMGAAGVGLFRTEYLYLTHPVVPGEEEQLAEYRSIIAASPRHRVTIRTLDLGGDKTVPFLGHTHPEANPFMGWRSIRMCFEHPEFLQTQLRAIMRAAATARELGGEVHLLFPMITTVEELHRVRALVRRAKEQLNRDRQPWAAVPLGMMLEVPAAAVCIDAMLSLIDFVSIGSNDLVQYLMAADRDNPKVSHLCQPLAPAVLRVLRQVIAACQAAGKPVTVCGEMAGQPRAFAVLLGMGLRRFSMSPAFVPYVKECARHLSTTMAQDILQHVSRLQTTNRIARHLAERLAEVFPEFDQFDVGSGHGRHDRGAASRPRRA